MVAVESLVDRLLQSAGDGLGGLAERGPGKGPGRPQSHQSHQMAGPQAQRRWEEGLLQAGLVNTLSGTYPHGHWEAPKVPSKHT